MDANLLVSIAFVGFGAYLVIFNRNFTRTAIRQQKAVWKIDSSRYEVVIRVFATIVGVVLMSAGLLELAQIMSS